MRVTGPEAGKNEKTFPKWKKFYKHQQHKQQHHIEICEIFVLGCSWGLEIIQIHPMRSEKVPRRADANVIIIGTAYNFLSK